MVFSLLLSHLFVVFNKSLSLNLKLDEGAASLKNWSFYSRANRAFCPLSSCIMLITWAPWSKSEDSGSSGSDSLQKEKKRAEFQQLLAFKRKIWSTGESDPSGRRWWVLCIKRDWGKLAEFLNVEKRRDQAQVDGTCWNFCPLWIWIAGQKGSWKDELMRFLDPILLCECKSHFPCAYPWNSTVNTQSTKQN